MYIVNLNLSEAVFRKEKDDATNLVLPAQNIAEPEVFLDPKDRFRHVTTLLVFVF